MGDEESECKNLNESKTKYMNYKNDLEEENESEENTRSHNFKDNLKKSTDCPTPIENGSNGVFYSEKRLENPKAEATYKKCKQPENPSNGDLLDTLIKVAENETQEASKLDALIECAKQEKEKISTYGQHSQYPVKKERIHTINDYPQDKIYRSSQMRVFIPREQLRIPNPISMNIQNQKNQDSFSTRKKKTALEYLLDESKREFQLIQNEEDKQYKKIKPKGLKKPIDTPPPSKGRPREIRESRKESSGLESSDLYNIRDFNDIEDSKFPLIAKNGKKEYFCPEEHCNKSFPSLSRIKRHYIVHIGVRPFKCLNQRCHKSFSRKDNMLQHFRSHCSLTKSRRV